MKSNHLPAPGHRLLSPLPILLLTVFVDLVPHRSPSGCCSRFTRAWALFSRRSWERFPIVWGGDQSCCSARSARQPLSSLWERRIRFFGFSLLGLLTASSERT